MFAIEIAGKLYGPFKSAADAAEWARKELGGIGGGPWAIKPLRQPDDD